MTTDKLILRLKAIYDEMVQAEPFLEGLVAGIAPKYRPSAKNLYRYLILRSYDLRAIHDSLSELGLSALRTSESYVLSNLDQVLQNLYRIEGQHWDRNQDLDYIGLKKSKNLLRKHTKELFNRSNNKHRTEIMVTLPNEAAEDKDLLRDLIKAGMAIARINLSHGDVAIWTKMIEHIRKLEKELNRMVKIYIDLAGPKIRTGDIEVLSKKGTIKSSISIKAGDRLLLSRWETKGQNQGSEKDGSDVGRKKVSVQLPQIIADLKVGESVFFDDGMIRGQVVAKNADEVELEITEAYKKKLAARKGINLPDTRLNLPSLTEQDIALLPFVCANADIVGYSFVRTPEDVEMLYQELAKYKRPDLGVVFKIENKEAFENLPLIMLAGMKRKSIGVMIARGDLAVEIGFERISEVQSQILWLCEAAHVPVIWATQVLDNLAKTGIPTRAEITDASISAKAECVMLNKGPYIVDAVRTLKNIIIKMETHSYKRKSALRPLKVAVRALNQFNKK